MDLHVEYLPRYVTGINPWYVLLNANSEHVPDTMFPLTLDSPLLGNLQGLNRGRDLRIGESLFPS